MSCKFFLTSPPKVWRDRARTIKSFWQAGVNRMYHFPSWARSSEMNIATLFNHSFSMNRWSWSMDHLIWFDCSKCSDAFFLPPVASLLALLRRSGRELFNLLYFFFFFWFHLSSSWFIKDPLDFVCLSVLLHLFSFQFVWYHHSSY